MAGKDNSDNNKQQKIMPRKKSTSTKRKGTKSRTKAELEANEALTAATLEHQQWNKASTKKKNTSSRDEKRKMKDPLGVTATSAAMAWTTAAEQQQWEQCQTQESPKIWLKCVEESSSSSSVDQNCCRRRITSCNCIRWTAQMPPPATMEGSDTKRSKGVDRSSVPLERAGVTTHQTN